MSLQSHAAQERLPRMFLARQMRAQRQGHGRQESNGARSQVQRTSRTLATKIVRAQPTFHIHACMKDSAERTYL